LGEAGNVYVTGFFESSSLDFNPGTRPGVPFHLLNESYGGADGFILKLDHDGRFAWVTQMDSRNGGITYPSSIAADKGYIYTAGAFKGTTDFDPAGGKLHSLTSMGQTDNAFILKLRDCLLPPVRITVNKMELGVTHPEEYVSWQWFLDGNKIAGATDSVYLVRKNGVYRVEATGSGGCVSTASYTVTNVTDIHTDHYLNPDVKIYPNPATDQIFIISPETASVTLAGIDGRTLYRTALYQGSISIDLSAFSSGCYILQIRDRNGALVKVEKLVINPS